MHTDATPAVRPSWSRRRLIVFRIGAALLGIQMIESLADASYWTRDVAARVLQPIERLPGYPWFAELAARSDSHAVLLGLVRDVLLALLLAMIWSRLDRRNHHEVAAARVRIFLRYLVGTVMVIYGGLKVVPVQFPTPSAEQLLTPLGQRSPMGLLWAFVGSSPGYSVFCGLVEWTGGALLFWRRTATLGALLCAGALVQVTALNFFYDVPVKRGASLLLLASVVLASRDAGRLASVLWHDRPTAPGREAAYDGGSFARRARAVLKPVFVALVLLGPMVGALALRPRPPAPSAVDGHYAIEGADGAGASLPAPFGQWRRLVLGDRGGAVVQDSEGSCRRYRQVVDPDARTLALELAGQPALRFRYHARPDGGLRLVPADRPDAALELARLDAARLYRVLGGRTRAPRRASGARRARRGER